MERLVLVHGSVGNGKAACAAQRLAERYELVVLNRPGYPPNPPEEQIDFENQASWVRWSPASDAVCDVLEERLGAQRAVVPGAGHNPQLAEGFNERLLEFLTSSGSRSQR